MWTIRFPTMTTKTMTKRSPLPPLPELTPGFLLSHAFIAGVTVIMAYAAASFENATQTMAFYGVYHREPWNQLIHFWGVPLLVLTVLTFTAHLPLTSAVQVRGLPGIPSHYATFATLWFLGYLLFYFSIDLVGTLLYAPFLYGMYAAAVRWTAADQQEAKIATGKQPVWTGTGRLLRITFWLHVLAWYVQIHPGHRVIEGAQPAIMTSLGGALTSAPLFSFYEGLWFVGLRKEFQAQVQELVDVYTKQLCDEGAVMRACQSLARDSPTD
jgi:uncharacterized membrane protein YGL010W